jgi:hypothetical protein
MQIFYGPLLQFDISERSFTCTYDIFFLLGAISDFDLAVILVSISICLWQVYEYYNVTTQYTALLFYSVETMVIDLITEKNFNYFDTVNMLFAVIFLSNFSGLLPYSQTVTSQLLLTLIISMILMFGL